MKTAASVMLAAVLFCDVPVQLNAFDGELPQQLVLTAQIDEHPQQLATVVLALCDLFAGLGKLLTQAVDCLTQDALTATGRSGLEAGLLLTLEHGIHLALAAGLSHANEGSAEQPGSNTLNVTDNAFSFVCHRSLPISCGRPVGPDPHRHTLTNLPHCQSNTAR